VLSSKPDKNEAKFASRLDVLIERVDTLASTVATTASATAKRDGEIAALRKELDARDQRLASLVAQPRDTTATAEVQELRQAVAALASERSRNGGTSKALDDLAAKVTLLGQRLESVSTTVSTTAAGLAGRDGELAALRKRIESLPASAATVAAADPAASRRMGDLVADVTTTRVQLQNLADDVAALKTLAAEPVETSSPLADDVVALMADVTEAKSRLAGLDQHVGALKALVERQAADAARPSEEIREMLAALRTKVEDLGELAAGGASEDIDDRLEGIDARVGALTGRVDSLATTIDSAVVGITEKEGELAELHRHFSASSGRIESIAEDIRDALAVFPEPGSVNADDLVVRIERMADRIERIERATREHAETRERLASELSRRIEAIDAQVATVASDVARAKTLWPVALRSLEARLDDVTGSPNEPEARGADEPRVDESGADDDLLAGLRDSLQAMETVAAEMARASDVLSTDEPSTAPPTAHEAVVAGGALIVPLRSSDP